MVSIINKCKNRAKSQIALNFVQILRQQEMGSLSCVSSADAWSSAPECVCV